jgi:exopolysaccharide biosynthesis polyprenyl glycosylphosphotransferase
MFYGRRKIYLKLIQLFDLGLVCAAFLLTALMALNQQADMSFGTFLGMRIKIQNFILFLGMLFIWHTIFSSFDIYNSKRLSSKKAELLDILKATSAGTLSIFIIGTLFHKSIITPISIMVFWLLISALVIFSRLLGRFILEHFRLKGHNLRCMLIAGTNSRALGLARRIDKNPRLGYKIIGFVDDYWAGLERFKNSGYSVACSLNDLSSFLRDNVVDEIVISLPVKSSYDKVLKIIHLCEQHGIVTRLFFDLFNQKKAPSKPESFEDVQLLKHTKAASLAGEWPVLLKHVLDFCFSLIALIMLAPLFFIIGLIIKLTSPGPVFFIQERVGFNKRIFRLYKFRTMVPNAEKMIDQLEHLNEIDGPAFKIKNDPRITPIGKFLRKTSIDEWPQLINVLKGEMSLVGPRPLPLRDYNGFTEDWQRRRFSVRPGITCLWQINGRTNVSFCKWMELDLQYIDNWSLWLDLKIIAKTIPAIIRGTGAC